MNRTSRQAEGCPAEPELLQLGEQTAEAIRQLNHWTRRHDAFTYPAEFDSLLADLAVTARRLPQLLDQLRAWLEDECDNGRLHADNQTSPAELVGLAAHQLIRARQNGGQLAAALDSAHQHTAHLAAV